MDRSGTEGRGAEGRGDPLSSVSEKAESSNGPQPIGELVSSALPANVRASAERTMANLEGRDKRDAPA